MIARDTYGFTDGGSGGDVEDNAAGTCLGGRVAVLVGHYIEMGENGKWNEE